MLKKIILLLSVILFSIGLLYSAGTKAGDQIIAASSNVIMSYFESGGTVSKNGAAEGIADLESIVMEINGLVETATDFSQLTALWNGSGYLLTTANTDYILKLSYLNRGNTTEDIKITSGLTEESGLIYGNWQVNGQESLAEETATLAEDAIVEFTVTLSAQEVINTERITLDILTKLITANNVVSYNRFTDAYIAYSGPGGFSGYGGTDNISHSFTITAQGFDIGFVTRNSAVVSPIDGGYAGNAIDLVPGSKITYTITIKNNTSLVAKDIIITDKIATGCHYYPGEESMLGERMGSEVLPSLTNSAGPGSDVIFQMDIDPLAMVTCSYTVTLD